MNKQSNISSKVAVPLKRILGFSATIMMVVGTMIGTGIFKEIAPMAATGLGPDFILLAWLTAGLITLAGALSISALAELTDESGGEYEYLRIIFGDFTAFIFGWTSFTIIGSASAAAMSYLFTESYHQIFQITLLNNSLYFKLATCAGIILLSLFNILGTRESAWLNNLMTYLKIAGVLFVIFGAFYFEYPKPLHTVFSGSWKIDRHSNPIGLFLMMMLSAFWAYDGWLNVSFISGEIKDPKKNVPKAIVSGIVLVMILYVLINYAFMQVMSLSALAGYQNGIAAAGVCERMLGTHGKLLISLLIIFSTFGSLNGNIITYSRMYYKMGMDGVFFKKTAIINKRFQTPHWSLIFSMLMSCVLVFTGSFYELTNMIVFAGFLFYALLAWGVISMKRKKKILARKIGYPWLPLLFIVFSICLLINAFAEMPRQSLMGLLLMISAVPVYFLFKSRKPGTKD